MSLANLGFSNSIQRYGVLTGSLAWLSMRPLAELVFKDLSCFNAPKMTLARTREEFLDVAELELPNTAVTLGSSLVLPPLLQRAMGRFSRVAPANLAQSIEKICEQAKKPTEQALSKIKLAKLGVSLAFCFPFAAGFWAVPFFRNYLTLARTNTINFDAIVGLKGETSSTGKRSVKEEKAYQLGRAFKVLATGLALGAASFFGLGKMAKTFTGQTLSKKMDWLFQTFHLGGKKSNEIQGFLGVLTFWSLPAYLGWIDAARTKNERIEQSVKAVNSIMWFSVLGPVVGALFYKNAFRRILGEKVPKMSPGNLWKLVTRQEIPGVKADLPISYQNILDRPLSDPKRAALLRLKNRQYGLELLQAIVLLGSTPQLLNIFFTKRRHERAMAAQRAAQTPFAANPFGALPGRPLPAQALRISVTPGLAIHADSPFSALTRAQRAAMA